MEATDQEFVEWWSLVHSRISSIARRYLRDDDAVEDMMQDLAIVAYKRLATFSTYSHFEAWLTKRVRWLALNRLRVVNREVDIEKSPELGVDAEVYERLRVAHLEGMMARLPSAQARVLYLTACGLTSREIAGQIKIAEPTVRSLRRHGRLALRRMLELEEVEDDQLS